MTMISPTNTAPYLTDPNRGPDYAGYLRVAINDKVQGAIIARFAWEQLKVKRAATIHDGSVYAEQMQAVFVETFKKLGGTIATQEAIAPTDTDMRPVLSKIAVTKPEMIFYPIYLAAAGQITRQVRGILGLKDTLLMSGDNLLTADFYRVAGEAAVGMYHSGPDLTGFTGGYPEFLTKYEKKYGEKPVAVYHAYGYDTARMLFAAIEKATVKGPDGSLYIGRKALRDAVYATKGFQGLTGTLDCDANGDCANPKNLGIYRNTADNIKNLKPPDKPIWKPN
jgi:branched-chain amino acid transport system substrate-binding protein